MSPIALVLTGTGIIAGAGVATLVLVLTPRLATLVAGWGAVLGGAVGLVGALLALSRGSTAELAASWPVPGGELVIALDPLGAFFLAPLFTLGPLSALYGRRYLAARAVPAAGLDLLLASMAVVVLARHAILFLVAWEAMTLLAYLLITVEDEKAEVRRAGWVYLIASHVASIALLGLFAALGARAGGALDFTSLATAWHAEPAGSGAILALALFGFGIKAGVLGVHVWLPEAHAAAPSHVSALMSGVLIKLGLYGLLRTMSLVVAGPWLGVTLMILGVAGAIVGIVLATYQRDLKRILAYSSVENMGIILVGLGLALWAHARGDLRLGAIALAGSLLHIWNHAAMKGLLFLGAGSVLHGAGTKDIEALGGLARSMPWTGRALAVGAIAIAALPPLNGLTGEWLLYQALARVGVADAGLAGLAAMAGAAALALVGGLAALCFVRLVGVVLLGTPRSESAARAHESPAEMIGPMIALGVACVAAALAAPILTSFHHAVLLALVGAGETEVAFAAGLLAPLVTGNAALLLAIGLAVAVVAWRTRRADRTETWACGYAAATARMQYTGRGFAELFTTRVLPRWLRGRAEVHAPEGLFPRSAAFAGETTDPLTRAAYEPLLARLGSRFAALRFLQQGNVHIYLLYILATAIGALAWVAARDWLSL